jgi:hydrogenase expression/formation protein HypD
MEAILAAPDNRVQGFLAAGHVCTVMGLAEYGPLAARFRVPIVVTGFEPVDILRGVLECVEQLETGRAEVTNAYARAVRPDGNPHAQRVVREVFTIVDRPWRGLGVIPRSGLGLRPEFASFDALLRQGGLDTPPEAATGCIAGDILRGNAKPHQCPAYGTRCTPEQPLGAPMVSSEGACAAYYRYRRRAPA